MYKVSHIHSSEARNSIGKKREEIGRDNYSGRSGD
jgi:hypothetical protein